MTQKIIKKTEETVLTVKENRGVTYLSFPILEDTGLVSHAFSTRLGGVSKGDFATMNFSFTRGDDRDDVLENYRRMAAALGVDRERMVLTWQTHTTNVRRVTEEDEGKGILRDRDYRDVDGLITDIPGITLVTFFADCVPLYFLDPVHKAIGLSHSGWRGTVKRMGQVTVDAMKEAFGTRPEDIIACIGPSICGDCYEVGEEVADEFADAFHEKYHDVILLKKQNGKYQLDLWKANEIVLKEAGIKGDNLAVTNICTYCNPQLLFSHRRTAERRGNLCAFLSLKEK
ncbi:peptidoglycan editing factor PgeF [[Clostridium] symbiosum]|uniref:peptidoglycan editing factor PgeF n=1 Tax=Clostridium symbiosum TaxID=1512 RepID=UPI0011074730|nr:peptidoglycan editing factor PgeF [[Clostridium] symbiosum]